MEKCFAGKKEKKQMKSVSRRGYNEDDDIYNQYESTKKKVRMAFEEI